MTAGAFVAATAEVAPSCSVGEGSHIWDFAQIRERAKLGTTCTVGRGAYVGAGVQIGNNCKIQNNALVYQPADIGDGVFIGPAAVLTNDRYPRAVNPDGTIKLGADWTAVGVSVRNGASIGANAVCIAPVTIGEWALVAAGSVVTSDVAAHSLVAGAPARHISWVGRDGCKLSGGVSVDVFGCDHSPNGYLLINGTLTERGDTQ
jgi:UDP-2-acetamido-3-amino-2,3-dideoxy-glucuronate N-acetyltransferase